jgi:hypothetical protein
LEQAFREALLQALRLIELSKEFLKQKKAERNAYWQTPEGRAEREARWAEIKKMYKHENETFLFRLGLRRHARAAQSANHIRRA